MNEPLLAPFKICSGCGHAWATRDEFIDDPSVHIIGYQVNFKELQAGLFLFNHQCQTTLALEVGPFTDLVDVPVFRERQTENPDCLGLCLNRWELSRCPLKCECAFVRDIIQIIRQRNEQAKIATL